MTYYTRVLGFSGIGHTREGPRFSIIFAFFVKKIFISSVQVSYTKRAYNVQKKQISISM